MSTTTVLAAPDFLRDATAPVPCATRPDLFHSDDPADVARAVDLCLDCPLMLACRDWARAQGEYGVAGGETEAERAAAGRKPVRNAKTKALSKGCGTEAGAKAHRRRGEPGAGLGGGAVAPGGAAARRALPLHRRGAGGLIDTDLSTKETGGESPRRRLCRASLASPYGLVVAPPVVPPVPVVPAGAAGAEAGAGACWAFISELICSVVLKSGAASSWSLV